MHVANQYMALNFIMPATASLTSKYLIVVVGPTAIGKTACCIQLAQRFRTEIISADARQCYKDMVIGTAQPTPATMQGVQHHLIHFLPIQSPYNAGMFAKDALAILTTLFHQYNYVLMTGGAGLYIKAFCEGLATMPPVDPAIRIMLNKRLQKEGLSALATELAHRDPAYYQIVERTNPHRIMRALEVSLATGQPYSQFRIHQPTQHAFKIIKVGLTIDRQLLYERINQRVEQMLNEGLLDEAISLYPYRHHNALQTVGYHEIFGYMDGHYSQKEAIELIKRNTRRYAKRQLTWFRKDPDIRWFHPNDQTGILNYIQRTLSRK